MGGSRSSTPKQPKSKTEASPMDVALPFMAMMQQQQSMQSQQASAEAEAQRQAQLQAQIQAQQQAGMQAQQAGEAAAQNALSGMNVGQQAQDQSAIAGQQKAAGFATPDVGQIRQASLGTMAGGQQGAASQAANIGAGGTPQRANMFNLPTAVGLTFGGA